MASSSPPTMSPSRNSISNWLKLLKKSDSSNDVTSPSNSTFNPSNLDLSEPSGAAANTSAAEHHGSDPPASNLAGAPAPANSRLYAPTPTKRTNSGSSPRKNSNPLSLNLLSPQKSGTPQPLSSSPTPSRPFLGFKSRSSHSFRPLSQFLDPSSSSHQDHHSSSGAASGTASDTPDDPNGRLRSHRDSFLQQRQLDVIGNSSIFGCDIESSTKLAHGTVYISADVPANTADDTTTTTTDSDANTRTSTSPSTKHLNVAYGQVPLVIVSCGSYLKANALNVEGVFRLSGSNKRIKHLQMIFSTPPDYGAKIDWDGYTVHDAASLLRRYLGSLSEPLIPFNLYNSFRDPLLEKKELFLYLKEKDSKGALQVKPDKQKRRVIVAQRRRLLKKYALLFQKLPPIQHRVLFYLVDMLAMFNLKSDKNRMPAKNLAAIFQPSILFHLDHDMNPEEYAANSVVIEFMITYSHKILVNVQREKPSPPLESTPAQAKNEAISSSRIPTDNYEKIVEEADELDDLDEMDECGEAHADTKASNEQHDENVKVSNENHHPITSDAFTHIKPAITVEIPAERTSPNSKTQSQILYHPNDSRSSPLRGSPLRQVFTPVNDNHDISGLENLGAPVTLFSSPRVTRSRPHSKSLSHVPYSEVVRIPASCSISSNFKALGSTDDNLSRIMSNQSGVSSLLSSRLGSETAEGTTNRIDNALAPADGNNLINELGLHQPDAIHEGQVVFIDNSSEVSCLAKPPGLQNPSDCPDYDHKIHSFIPPISPTTATMSRDDTPDVENMSKNFQNNSKNLTQSETSHSNNTGVNSIDEYYSLHDGEKRSNMSTASDYDTDSMIGTNEDTGKSSNSLAFSFQPSLLQGHKSNDDMHLLNTRARDNSRANSKNLDDSSQNQRETSPFLDYKVVQYSHPDIVNDPSLLRKTATTPSFGSTNASLNDESGVISSKKRSNSINASEDKGIGNSGTNKQSGIFSIVATHMPNSNTNRNVVSSSEKASHSSGISKSNLREKGKGKKETIEKGKDVKSKERSKDREEENFKDKEKIKDKTKEKRTWFDKLKNRSNAKRL